MGSRLDINSHVQRLLKANEIDNQSEYQNTQDEPTAFSEAYLSTYQSSTWRNCHQTPTVEASSKEEKLEPATAKQKSPRRWTVNFPMSSWTTKYLSKVKTLGFTQKSDQTMLSKVTLLTKPTLPSIPATRLMPATATCQSARLYPAPLPEVTPMTKPTPTTLYQPSLRDLPHPDLCGKHPDTLKIISLKIQKRRWLDILNEPTDVVCVKEGQFLSSARLGIGHITNSESNKIRIWSKNFHICLNNTKHIQIVTIKLSTRSLIVVNVHLDYQANKRKKQIQELISDIAHIRTCALHSMANITVCGDFNFKIQRDSIDGLSARGPSLNTWRKSPAKNWSSVLDHVFVAYHIPAKVDWIVTESDHLAAKIEILGLCQDKGQGCLTITSRLSRSKTHKLEPKTWQQYPTVPIYSYLSGKRMHWTIKDEEGLKELRSQQREAILKSKLATGKQWIANNRLFQLAPYTFAQLQLSSKGQPLLSKIALIHDTKEKLDKATNQKHYMTKAQWPRLCPNMKTWYLNRMMIGIHMIDTNSSCGPDRVHPSWIRDFDRQHEPHLLQIRQILCSALDKPDFFSEQPVLIPKKDGNVRPIMVLNNPLRYLEKGLLATLNDIEFTTKMKFTVSCRRYPHMRHTTI